MTCSRHNNHEQQTTPDIEKAIDILTTRVANLEIKLETVANSVDRDMKDKWQFISDLKKFFSEEIDQIKKRLK